MLEQGGNIEVKGAFVIFPNSWGVFAHNLISEQVKLPAVSALCGLSVGRCLDKSGALAGCPAHEFGTRFRTDKLELMAVLV